MHTKGWYICTNRCEATVREAGHERQCRGSVVGVREGLELCWVHLDGCREVKAWPNPQRRDPN